MALAHMQQQFYTFKDLIEINDGIRHELIDGIIYDMASPSAYHQSIVLRLGSQLDSFLRTKKCKVFISPFDVRLNAANPSNRDDTVLQPDVLVICDRSKLDPKGLGYKGAPDLVIEVLSGSTAYMDRVVKFGKYQEAEVREYWIVDPASKTVKVYVFETGDESSAAYVESDSLPVFVLPGCNIDLSDVFAE